MCFFNAVSWNAVKIASRYRRRFDAVEAWKQIMAGREPRGIAGQNDIYRFRLAEEMYCIPAYNEPHCIIVSGSDQLQVMDWGLIPRGTKPETKERYILRNWHKNARAEDIFSSWPWKFLIRRKRCLIPSTGYFEYHYISDNKTQPYFIYLIEREIFSMGGLWDEWTEPDTGKVYKTFVQITTAANTFTQKIHNGGKNPYRMPLILREEDEERWLDPGLTDEDIRSLLKPYPAEGMAAYPVSKSFKEKDPYDIRIIREDKDVEQGTFGV